jgi:hypothetical protein
MVIDIKDINIVLICVIIVLVIFCLIRNEHFVPDASSTTACGSNVPYAEITPFHPNVEGTEEVDPNNYIFTMTNNSDSKEIYGLGSSELPVASNDGL